MSSETLRVVCAALFHSRPGCVALLVTLQAVRAEIIRSAADAAGDQTRSIVEEERPLSSDASNVLAALTAMAAAIDACGMMDSRD